MNEENEPLPRRTNWPSLRKRSTEPDEPKKDVKADKPPPKTDKDGKKLSMRPVIMLPTSDAAILNNLVCRELVDPSGPLDPPSPSIALLKSTVETIAQGGDITPFQKQLERVAANQPEKAELVMAQLNQINDERIPRLIELQDNSERVVVSASRRGDVNVSEALCTWRLANQELALLLKAKADGRGSIDGKAAVDKISTSQQSVDRITAEKWEYTSPQGREIIRKKLWEIKREIIAKQTVTTTTTVETPAEPAQNPA